MANFNPIKFVVSHVLIDTLPRVRIVHVTAGLVHSLEGGISFAMEPPYQKLIIIDYPLFIHFY